MRRTSLFIALASALSLPAFAGQPGQKHSAQISQTESSQSRGASQQGSQQQSSSQQEGSQRQAHSPDVVKQVQEKLSAEGHKVTTDGKMGPQTQAALKEYQQQNGLQATGQIDQETLAKLGIESGSAATGGSSSGTSRSGAQGSGSSSSGSGDQSNK